MVFGLPDPLSIFRPRSSSWAFRQERLRSSVRLKLKHVGFMYEAFLYSVEEIRDAVMDEDLNGLLREIEKGKLTVQTLAGRAPQRICREYLHKALSSFDIFKVNVMVDLEKYPERAWGEIKEHLWEFRDRNMEYLIMAVQDLG